MTGLRINFNGLAGWTLDLSAVVSGVNAVVQDALVLTAMNKGFNVAVPEAGSDLLLQGSAGLFFDKQNSQHQLNFAAARSKEVLNTESVEAQDTLSTFLLQLSTFAPPTLTVNAYAETQDGEKAGQQINVTA